MSATPTGKISLQRCDYLESNMIRDDLLTFFRTIKRERERERERERVYVVL